MTVDERIEALTARHEAIAQSVELLGSFHRDTEAAMQKLDEKLTAKIDTLTSQVGLLTGHMDTIASHMNTIASHMNTIAQLVIGHEQRMQKLESGK